MGRAETKLVLHYKGRASAILVKKVQLFIKTAVLFIKKALTRHKKNLLSGLTLPVCLYSGINGGNG